VKLALFACSASAMAEPGPIVKASVGVELLGPKLPEKVLLLRIRQKPPDTVRDLGFSIVAVGWGAAALAIKNIVAIIVKKNCLGLILVPMMSGIVNWRDFGFNSRDCHAKLSTIQKVVRNHTSAWERPHPRISRNCSRISAGTKWLLTQRESKMAVQTKWTPPATST